MSTAATPFAARIHALALAIAAADYDAELAVNLELDAHNPLTSVAAHAVGHLPASERDAVPAILARAAEIEAPTASVVFDAPVALPAAPVVAVAPVLQIERAYGADWGVLVCLAGHRSPVRKNALVTHCPVCVSVSTAATQAVA